MKTPLQLLVPAQNVYRIAAHRLIRSLLRHRVPHVAVDAACIVWLLVGLTSPWILRAQLRAQQEPHALTDSARLATITTDTGDLAPGHRDFSRYQTVEICDVAARNAITVLRRTLGAQAAASGLKKTPERDTLPAGVAAVARACTARYTMSGLAQHDAALQATQAEMDLPILFDLALLAGNDTLAHAVEAQVIAIAPTPAVRIRWLQQFIDRYLIAEPARVTAAEALVAQIDALGQSAQTARVQAHWQLLVFGQQTFDRARIRREAEQIIALMHDMTREVLLAEGEGRKDAALDAVIDLQRSYQALLKLAVVDSPDSLQAIAQRAQQDFRWPALEAFLQKYRNDEILTRYADVHIDTEPIETVLANFEPAGQGAGEPFPRFQASVWFPADDSVQPRPGTVTLFTGLPGGCWGGLEQSMCVEVLTRVQQWLAQYGSAGLAVTVMVRTHGHSFYSGPQTPAEEARNYAWYVRDYWKLPVAVAVRVMPVSFHPAPDGTKEEDTAAFNTRFPDQYEVKGMGVEIAGRDGRLLFRGGDWPQIDALLERLFPNTVATPSPARISPTSTPPSSPPVIQ